VDRAKLIRHNFTPSGQYLVHICTKYWNIDFHPAKNGIPQTSKKFPAGDENRGISFLLHHRSLPALKYSLLVSQRPRPLCDNVECLSQSPPLYLAAFSRANSALPSLALHSQSSTAMSADSETQERVAIGISFGNSYSSIAHTTPVRISAR
jgi:hypothetical protein